MDRRRVRVVESEAVEEAGEELDVSGHVLPQPRVVIGTGAEPQLDAVGPDDQVPTKVRPRVGGGKVLERVRVPDPAVVGESEGARILRLCAGRGGEASKEALDQGRSGKQERESGPPATERTQNSTDLGVTGPKRGPWASRRVYWMRFLVLSRIAARSELNSS